MNNKNSPYYEINKSIDRFLTDVSSLTKPETDFLNPYDIGLIGNGINIKSNLLINKDIKNKDGYLSLS